MKLHVAHFLERCTLNTLYNYHISSSCLTIELEAVSVGYAGLCMVIYHQVVFFTLHSSDITNNVRTCQ